MTFSGAPYYPNPNEPLLAGARFSFAQNWEDAYLHRVLGDIDAGFYVDVGAWHPTRDSVTRLFYDRGWSGINLEPGEMFEELATARVRDINLPVAIAKEAGQRRFLDLAEPDGSPAGTSHFGANGETPSDQRESRMVEVRPLSDVLAEHAADREIHFLKVDVEGAEREVLLSNDWKRFRPWVVVVEATAPGTQQTTHHLWEDVLAEARYIRAFFDGLNMYYVRDDKADFAASLNLPINVFDQFRQFDPHIAELRGALANVEAELAEARRVGEVLEENLTELQSAYEALTAERRAQEVELERLRRAADAAQAESERVCREQLERNSRLALSASRLRRLQDRYRLDGATRELRIGLWLARRLRQFDRLMARALSRERLFLRPMKDRFLVDPLTGESDARALLSQDFVAILSELKLVEARAQERDRVLLSRLTDVATVGHVDLSEIRSAERERQTAQALQSLLLTIAARPPKS